MYETITSYIVIIYHRFNNTITLYVINNSIQIYENRLYNRISYLIIKKKIFLKLLI